MTSYRISLGYNSNGRVEFPKLKEIALEIADNPARITIEALDYGAPAEIGGDTILDYATSYQTRTDMTLRFIEESPNYLEDHLPQHVLIYASGGEPGRSAKEHLARAFCRLVIESAHKQGIEVNLNVG